MRQIAYYNNAHVIIYTMKRRFCMLTVSTASSVAQLRAALNERGLRRCYCHNTRKAALLALWRQDRKEEQECINLSDGINRDDVTGY